MSLNSQADWCLLASQATAVSPTFPHLQALIPGQTHKMWPPTGLQGDVCCCHLLLSIGPSPGQTGWVLDLLQSYRQTPFAAKSLGEGDSLLEACTVLQKGV